MAHNISNKLIGSVYSYLCGAYFPGKMLMLFAFLCIFSCVEDQRTYIVPYRYGRVKSVLLDITIGDKIHPFCFDTGAPQTLYAVNNKDAESNGYRFWEHEIKEYISDFDNIKIGDLSIDVKILETEDIRIPSLLGWDIISQYYWFINTLDTTMTISNKPIFMTTISEDVREMQFELRGDYIYLKDDKYNILVDTGMSFSLIWEEEQRKVYVDMKVFSSELWADIAKQVGCSDTVVGISQLNINVCGFDFYKSMFYRDKTDISPYDFDAIISMAALDKYSYIYIDPFNGSIKLFDPKN